MEVLENSSNEALLDTVSQFIDDLTNSGDDLLEQLLIVDVLEGIAQNPDLAKKFRTKISPKAVEFLEREYFGR
jgi:hypothetical protein